MKNILVAIPCEEFIEVETFESIWNLVVPNGYELDFRVVKGNNISQIRNLIANWAKHYDYLLAVDSDMVLPKDILRKMLAADKDIISGLYIQRKYGKQIVELYRVTPNGGMDNIPYSLLENRGIVEVAACGFGCCLIKSEVFRKMEYPHFVYKSALNHRDTVSEDVYFCKKARDIGFKVWADTSIKCDHIGAFTFSIDTPEQKNILEVYNQDLLPPPHIEYLKSMNISPKVIYDIGSCVLHWTRHAEKIWPESEIFLFEANPEMNTFYKNFKYKNHVGVLSDQDNKPVKFYYDPFNLGGNSYYKENTTHYNETHASIINSMTLDTIVKQNGYQYPDLIKIDVQGAEMDVLSGAKTCLSHCSDVILEAQHVEYNKNAPKIEEVINKMKTEYGFELVKIINKGQVDGDYHFTKIKNKAP